MMALTLYINLLTMRIVYSTFLIWYTMTCLNIYEVNDTIDKLAQHLNDSSFIIRTVYYTITI